MRIRQIPFLLVALGVLAAASHPGSSGSFAPVPDMSNPDVRLREDCKHLCIEARTAEEVSRCILRHELSAGEAEFKKAYPRCYEAHQKYRASKEHNGLERYG